MTASVVPDQASPCFGQQNWPGRAVQLASLTVVDNGDGTVTARATPYSGGEATTKTVNVADHTQVKAPTNTPAQAPKGGQLRWRCVDPDGEGDVVFSQKARAEARAANINAR